MRELAYLGPDRVAWREVPEPQLHGDVDALVGPIAVSTCDLDAAIVHGIVPFPAPYALGHECIADVVSVGSAVAKVKRGDRVAVPFQISCGRCDFCRRGLAANCTSVPRGSMYGTGPTGGDWGGVLADLVRVPFADAMLVPLPPGVSPAAAASATDNVADAWRAVGPQLAAYPGAPVLVLNGGLAGSIGLYAAQIALALGAARVDFHDADDARRSAARGLGAVPHPTAEWPRRLGPYPITVDNSQVPDGVACALRSTEPGGTCTSTTMSLLRDVEVPMAEMYMKGVTFLTGRVQARHLMPEVLELIRAGRFDPSHVTTETAAWDDAADAIVHYTTKLVVTR